MAKGRAGAPVPGPPFLFPPPENGKAMFAPPPPGPAARLPGEVARASPPAGEAGGGGPEGYWQGKAPHPSVG